MSQSPHWQPLQPMQSPPLPARRLPLGPQWPRKNHETMRCMSKRWARPSVLAPAANPLGWILPVLLLPFMGNEVDPCPGRIRTRSLNDTHRVRRPFPRWILRLPQNMVPAHLRKVTLTVIKGVYHERFAATHCTDFDYSQITAQAFHTKSIGLGSVYKARLDICIFCSFPNKTCL